MWIILILLVSIGGFGQVTYRVGLDANKTTYRVYMKSVASYTGIQAKISTAQVTLAVPHGIGANQFVPNNLQGKVAGTSQMSWGISRADAPTENQLVDYISFGYSGSGSAVLFNIPAGTEIELFNFQNSGNCLGTVDLITDTDPFLPPNSANSNPGNQMTILGFGQNNAYAGNYGGSVNCQSTFPDLIINITGAANITAGTATNYSITVNNIGTASSSGQVSVATTLPSGVSYNSFTGIGWNVSAAPQANGTTIVTTTNNNAVAINGSLSTLLLNVTAAASIGNGNSISITSLVSGGSDSNVTNNTSNTSSIVAVNTPNLALAMSGSATIAPNTSANYTLNVSNIGTAASSGAITASITVPNGLSYNSFSGSGWIFGSSTLQSGGATLITFTNNNVIATNGSANALIINLSAGNNLTNNTLLTIAGSISGGGDTTPANNSASVNTTVIVNTSSNLTVNISGSSNIIAGSSTNYTLNINNSGDASSSGTITAITTLPSGINYNSFTGTNWSVIATPQVNGTTLITATYTGSIVAGGAANALVLNVTPQTSINNGSTITINTVVSGGGDTTPVNNSGSINSIVANLPNLTVNINGTSTITAGVSNNFTININNTGNGATSGQITAVTTLPSGVTYNSFTGTGWSVIATPQANGTTLITATYTNNIIGGAGANPLILNVTPQASLGNGSSITINTVVSGGGNVNPITGSINAIISVIASPNLILSITGTSNVSAGSSGNYTVNIANNSVTNSTGLVITNITLPVGVSYNSFTGIGWSFAGSTPQANGTTLLTFTNNNAILGGGNSSSLGLNLSFSSTLTNNSLLVINGSISGGGSANHTNSISLTVINAGNPDLTLAINGTSSTAPDGAAAYTINVSNIGNASTNGMISVSLVIPNGLTYTSFSGNGWTYGSSVLQNGGAVLLTFTTNNIILANTLSNSLVVNLTAGNIPNGTIFTIAGNVSGGGENNVTNNTANTTLTIVIQGTPTLTAMITGPLSVNINTNYNYSINVSNIGNLATSGISTVSTILPAGVIYNSTSGNGWSSVATPQANGTILVVSSYNSVIPANGTASTLILNVTPSGILPTGSIIIINGSVTGGGATNTGNNGFTISSTIIQNSIVADLGVSVILDNKTPNLGQIINYTFSITNNGTGTPTNVQALIKLPPGFMIAGFSAASGNYNQTTGIWTIPNIQNGQTFTLTIAGKPTIEGIDFASIQLIYSNLQDNVTNNNIAKVCYATPVSLCNGEGYIAYLEKGVTNVKWFKNAILIASSSADSLLITTTGIYSASYTSTCGTIVNTPIINITSGSAPNPPNTTANRTSICGTETAQLIASNCTSTITWSNGATTSSILVSTAGTYTATCSNACGTSTTSLPLIITNNCGTVGQIGDFVWYDDNNNGKQDAGEAGVKGVILELYKNGLPTGQRDTTDASGKYLFINLSSGSYQVKISTLSLPTNYTLSRKSNAIGIADNLDSDFDFNTNLSQTVIINTSIPAQSINLTIDGGIRLNPEITINDPCKCFDVEYTLTEKKELYETVTVNGPKNETWTIIQQTGMLALDSLVKRPVLLGTAFIEVSAGKYIINFTHEDNVGYTLKVTNGEDTLSISNFCSVYPKVTVTDLGQTVCRNSPPILLNVTMSIPGTASYYYIDKLTNQKVVITSFDPKKFTAGETIYIKMEVLPSNGQLCSYIIKQTVQISVIDCPTNCKPTICVPISVMKTKN